MKKIDLGQAITILANIGVIAGIVFLGIELRQNSAAAELQAAQSYVNLSYELDFRLVDDPSLVASLRGSSEGRSSDDSYRVSRWYFGALRTWENGFYLNSIGVLDDELWTGQEAFIEDLLRSSDQARQHFETNRPYLSKSFVAFIDDLLQE